MATSTLTTKGQITIPKQVRDFLDLKAGDRLEFIIQPDGEVVLRPATVGLEALDGLLARADRPAVSLEDMQHAIEDAASESFGEQQ